jgi:DNA-binding PadR family transcriptional regulator
MERLFLEWAWFTRVPGGWQAAVRVLAHTLHGLEGAGLIERRTMRRAGRATHHGFVLTDLGREALDALSGEWIKDRQ